MMFSSCPRAAAATRRFASSMPSVKLTSDIPSVISQVRIPMRSSTSFAHMSAKAPLSPSRLNAFTTPDSRIRTARPYPTNGAAFLPTFNTGSAWVSYSSTGSGRRASRYQYASR